MKSRKKIKGYTLLELMITVAIVGILASVSVPAYQKYVIRAKIDQGYAFLQKARIHVDSYFAEQGRTKLSEINSSNLEERLGLVKHINTELIHDYWIAPWGGHDMTIWVRMQSDAPLPTELTGKWPFYLAGNIDSTGFLKWECKSDYHGGQFAKYATKACK